MNKRKEPVEKTALKIIEKAWEHRNDPPVYILAVTDEQKEKLEKDPKWRKR